MVIGPVFSDKPNVAPLADVCEKLGANFNYIEKKDIVTVEYGGKKLEVDIKQNIWRLDEKVLSSATEKYYFLERPGILYWSEDELMVNLYAFSTIFHISSNRVFTEEAYEAYQNDNLEAYDAYWRENGQSYKLLP